MKIMRISFIIMPVLFLISDLIHAQQFELISDTVTTDTGLKYAIIAEGNGSEVEPDKEVGFHWTGYFLDGTLFGTSVGGEPFYYITGRGQVIKGAEEGLALMRVGDRYLFIMPPELAYGEKGSGEVIPPKATLIFDYEVLSVTEPKLSIQDTISTLIQNEGADKAIAFYYQLRNNEYEKYAFRESTLNKLGYSLMRDYFLEEAVEIFKLNVKEYPNSWNVYDSLGEAYLTLGNNDLALQNYQKSVDLNPNNEAGKSAIKKLSE